MSSYAGNCYELVAEIRRGLNDYSTAKVQGSDTTGPFSNETIVKATNDSQKYLFDLLFTRMPHLFLKSTSLTASSGVFTLPSDFFKVKRLENEDKVKISPISVDQRHLNSGDGSKYLYYRKGNTLVSDYDGLGDTYTLFYYTRPRNLNLGQVSTAAANSMTLASTARAEADYYNNMKVEDITDGNVYTISDYTAAKVATIAGTPGTADYYGLIPEMPEEFHHLIGQRALMKLKSLPQAVVPVSAVELALFKEDLVETIRSYCGNVEIGDGTMEDIIYDLDPIY